MAMIYIIPPIPIVAAPVAWDTTVFGANIFFTNSNRTANKLATDAGWTAVRGTVSKSAGKRYFEMIAVSGAHSAADWGAATSGGDVQQRLGSMGVTSYGLNSGGTAVFETTFANGSAGSPTFANNDVIGFSIDFGAGKLFMAQNNSYTALGGGTSDPVTGVAPRMTFTANTPLFPAASLFGNSDGTISVTLVPPGSTSFAPPTGYVDFYS